MALTTYTELKASVADWLNRADLVATVPDFIALAEASMRRDIRARPEIQTIDIDIDTADYPLPCGFDGIVSLTRMSDDRRPLDLVPVSELDTITHTGMATRYSVSGDSLYFDTAPGNVRLRYRALFCPLSDRTRCNWILSKHPDAYLYGSLMQAAPYLREDDRIGVWGNMYGAAIDAINRQSIRQESGGPLKIKVNSCP
jgi:hypothetical protein